MTEVFDTFTFVTEGDRIRIFQHYKEPTEGGVISTPIGYFHPGSTEVKWTCENPPACLYHLWKIGAVGAQQAMTMAVMQHTGDLQLN